MEPELELGYMAPALKAGSPSSAVTDSNSNHSYLGAEE